MTGKAAYVDSTKKNLCLQILKKGDSFGEESAISASNEFPLIALGDVTVYKIETVLLIKNFSD